jgi:hypothetical protein
MPTDVRSRPDATEYAPYFHKYVSAVPDGDLLSLLRESGREWTDALRAVPEARGGFRYAENKWSIREVIGHVNDTERIFAYRALRIARGDGTPLASFEQDLYVPTSGAEARTIAGLVAEFVAIRESTVLLLESLPDEAWTRRGTASGKEVSVRALAYMTAGHLLHHRGLLRERYGVA